MPYELVILLCVFGSIVLGYEICDYCEKNICSEFLELIGCLLITIGVITMIVFIAIYFFVRFFFAPFPVPEVQSCFCNCDCCRK